MERFSFLKHCKMALLQLDSNSRGLKNGGGEIIFSFAQMNDNLV
jgi:hypothetical protein